MPKLNLTCPDFLGLFGDYAVKGQTESQAFLAWFLENYYRLDETEIDDAICDGEGDKGIDGIYVNDLLRQVDVFQARIGKANPPQYVGDTEPKEFLGTLTQLQTGDSVREVARTTRSDELRKLLNRVELDKRVEEGYAVKGIYITNKIRNQDTTDLLAVSPNLTLYDNFELERQYVSISKPEPIATSIRLSVRGVSVFTTYD